LPAWEAVLLGIGGLLLLYPEWMSDVVGLLLLTPSTTLTLISVGRQRRARSVG
jgi:UPF0716 family protein affecting phage T7 exclusion